MCECTFGYYDNNGVCEPLFECAKMEMHTFDSKCLTCKIKCETCPENPTAKCNPVCTGQCMQEDLDKNERCKDLGCIIDCRECGTFNSVDERKTYEF